MTDAILIVYIALLLILAGLLLMGISLMVEERLRVRAARRNGSHMADAQYSQYFRQWLLTGQEYNDDENYSKRTA